jgi:hypothetical protein
VLYVLASEKCQQEKRKTVNGEDILFAMTSLGFENYAEALKVYLSKYREVRVYSVTTLLRRACFNKTMKLATKPIEPRTRPREQQQHLG